MIIGLFLWIGVAAAIVAVQTEDEPTKVLKSEFKQSHTHIHRAGYWHAH